MKPPPKSNITTHNVKTTNGGKRHGKRLHKAPSEQRSGNITTDMAQAALAIDPNAHVLVNRHNIGKVLVYKRETDSWNPRIDPWTGNIVA